MQYDLFSSIFKRDPFPTYAHMREHAPVYSHIDPNGATIWYFTRYEDVLAVLRDTTRYVKDIRNATDKSLSSNNNNPINRNMLFSDAPDHTRLRTLVNLAFTPRRIAGLRPNIEQIAADLLATLPAPPLNPPRKGGDRSPSLWEGLGEGNTYDLISMYALPLPVIVICDLLGIPKMDREMVAEMSQSIISPGGKRLSSRVRRRKLNDFVAYLRELFQARTAEPQDDLITGLVQAEADGAKLTEAELSSMVALLLVTGHETTVNLIGNGVVALLRHPEQLQLLRERRELLPNAVEEMLRYDGPVETSTTRWCGVTHEYKGHLIERGDVIRPVITSANRDPAWHDDPDTFNIERENPRHLQFGNGAHYCLGASLARLEGEIAIGALLNTDLQLAVDVDMLKWKQGVLFRGLESLPVRL